ncbi:MAG: hypothetical protein K1X85_09810 [Ignavibacteria bacterium]|nr:hypothetical protein [Ignavibacteria bacterium]
MSGTRAKQSNRSKSAKPAKELNPAIEYSLLFVFALFIILFTTFKITGDDDVFWHLATGRYIIETGHVPSADIFGFATQGQEWMPFEWGWDVLTYGLFNLGGYEALSVFRTLIFLSIFWIFYFVLKKFKVPAVLSVAFMILLAFGIMDRLTPRPHAASLLFMSSLVYIFCDIRYFRRGSSKLMYLLPVIFLLWANIHMGIIAGLFFFAVYLAAEYINYHNRKSSVQPLETKQLKLLTMLFLLSVVLALANPNFIQTYVYAYEHTKMKMLETINEWKSPFDSMFGTGFVTTIYKVFLFGGLTILYYSFRKRDVFPALVYVSFALYSVRAVRFTVDYLIIIFVFLVVSIDFLLDEAGKRKLKEFLNKSLIPYALAGTLLIYLIINIPNNKLYLEQLQYYRVFGFGINPDFIPVQMFDFMKENRIPQTGERPLNHFGTGGFLVWNFPEARNFIDSRNLNDEIFSEYSSLMMKRPGFENKLRQYDFDYSMYLAPDLVRQPSEMEQTIVSYMSRKPDEWKLVFWDDKSFLFLKNLPKFKEIIDKYEYRYATPYNLIYNKQVIENALKNDPERLKSEIGRKLSEDPNGLIINTINRNFASKLNK